MTADAARFSDPDRRGARRRRRRDHDLAVHRQPQPGARHAGAVDHRGRSGAGAGRPAADRRRGAASRFSSTTARRRRSRRRRMSTSPTCATRRPDSARVKKPEWLVIVGVCTHLGCIPLGPEARRRPRPVWRLVLPVPRLGLRYLGAHPAGAGAAEPDRAALRLHLRHRHQDRLGSAMAVHLQGLPSRRPRRLADTGSAG